MSDSKMRGVIGLANLGNTCYMNSAIQAFRHCPEWTLFCKKGGELEKHIQTKDTADANANVRVALAYQDLIYSIWGGTGPAYVRPLGFYDTLKQIVRGTHYEDFIRRTPQDAHEFLVWLLDQMYMATQREVIIQINSPERLDPMILSAVTGWKNAFEKHYSPLTDLIFGMYRIQYTCGGCKTVHTRWETFNCLKIQLVANGEIMDSLHSEFKEEEIDGYACESCKQRTLTKKQASIWRLPKVLILSLKRFTPMGTRDNTPLVYNGEPLSFESVFAPESTEKSRATKFKLFATVDHHGSHMGGHYTSQCFSPVWKRWHRYDDETVSEIDGPRFGAQTYILMLR